MSSLRNPLFAASSGARGHNESNVEDVKVLCSAAPEPACRSISGKRRARIDMNVAISAKCGTEALLFVWNADNKSATMPRRLVPELRVQLGAPLCAPRLHTQSALLRLIPRLSTAKYVTATLFHRAAVFGTAAKSHADAFFPAR